MRQTRKALTDAQKREEKAAREQAKQEKEARSYNTVMQVASDLQAYLSDAIGQNITTHIPLIKLDWNLQMQAENMTSREAVKQQYESFQNYEDDFM